MGWATRAKSGRFGRPSPTHITGLTCATVAKALRKGLDVLGVSLDPQNDLARMLREIEWLASLGDGEPNTWRVATRAVEERIDAAAFLVEQALRIAAGLQMAERIENVDSLRRWLRKRINRLNGFDSEAQDHLLELEVAGRLARWPDLSVAIEEPDIVFTVRGHRVVIACKRPRGLHTVAPNVDRARGQIRQAWQASGARPPAIIVVGIESLLHSREDGSFSVPHFVEANEAEVLGSRVLDQAAEASHHEAQRAFDEGVSGILFMGSLSFHTERPPAYQSANVHSSLTSGEPGGRELSDQVKRLLFPRAQRIK
jgi:hypothetical protein